MKIFFSRPLSFRQKHTERFIFKSICYLLSTVAFQTYLCSPTLNKQKKKQDATME